MEPAASPTVTICSDEYYVVFTPPQGDDDSDFRWSVDLIRATPPELHFQLVMNPTTYSSIIAQGSVSRLKAERLYRLLFESLTSKPPKFGANYYQKDPDHGSPAAPRPLTSTDVLVLKLEVVEGLSDIWVVLHQVSDDDAHFPDLLPFLRPLAELERQVCPLEQRVDEQIRFLEVARPKLDQVDALIRQTRQPPTFAVLAQANWNGGQTCNWQPFAQAACPATAGLVRLETNKVIFPQGGTYRIRLQGGLDVVSAQQWTVTFQLKGAAVMTRNGYVTQSQGQVTTVDWGMEGIFHVAANDFFQLQYQPAGAGNYVPIGQNLLWIEKLA
ncbi:hypothetical protein PAPYR_8650 [Paratrimastix pyriformis]|uniref:Uncharacterized protein n=1 Tax=Paratrimastix pyriformis TaxID=342808 RepID=A0ABQ8UA67_9EUKA|nr:hypothetical protein PAPYR_8650 [Paratrimastix pyriformis]